MAHGLAYLIVKRNSIVAIYQKLVNFSLNLKKANHDLSINCEKKIGVSGVTGEFTHNLKFKFEQDVADSTPWTTLLQNSQMSLLPTEKYYFEFNVSLDQMELLLSSGSR